MRSAHPRSTVGLAFGVLVAMACVWPVRVAGAAPVLGFHESWSGTSVNGWGGSFNITYTNPGTGGVLGAGDGYLALSEGLAGHFGTESTGPEYVGDWLAAGITQIRLSLNDINTPQSFEIHLAIGNFNNLWEYTPGFIPPNKRWAEFLVDLTDSSKFTHIITLDGRGFLAALQDVQVLHIRHDLAPYGQIPDNIAGDLGIDDVILTDHSASVPVDVRPAAVAVELASPRPNPSHGPVVLMVESHDAAPVTIEIVDMAGRRVRSTTLADGAGTHVWMWDGRDNRGAPVGAGRYIARATSVSGGTSRTIVRIE
jgi:flagellar hook capping protein FlgD